MKRVLMIAFHFPPLAGGSGIHRTLRFVQHLPEHGWEPIVLTVHARAYAETGDHLLRELPRDLKLRRAMALDTSRHLAIRGRYLRAMALPDRWVSWRWDGVRQGMRLIREFRPDAIWSTYPIATAHLIAADLQARSRLPWVADFRDPMAQEGYPGDPVVWRSFKRVEAGAMRAAASCVFTTPSAARTYRANYPEAAARIEVVENGYDEASFAALEGESANPAGEPFILLHSGVVYPSERDPTHLFSALRRLREQGRVSPDAFRIRFRAPGHEQLISGLATDHGVEDLIEIGAPLPYVEALAEMRRSHGLLLLQAANCNEQIPAKFYEYLRAGRPILALTDPAGDTAAAMGRAGLAAIAPLDSTDRIAAALEAFVTEVRDRRAPLPDPALVRASSRRHRTLELAAIFDRVAGQNA